MHARAKSGSEIELHMSFSIDSTVCIYRSTSGFALSTSEKEGRIVGIAMVKWPSVMALLSGTCGERETFGQDRCHLWRGMSTRTCAVPHLDAEAPHARSVLNGHPVTFFGFLRNTDFDQNILRHKRVLYPQGPQHDVSEMCRH